MRWRVFLAIFLLVSIILGGICLLDASQSLCDEIISEIEASRSFVLSRGYCTGAPLKRAEALWKEKLPLICTFVMHYEADDVSACFEQAKAHLATNSWNEYVAALSKLSFLVELVRDYDKPSVRSLF